MKGPAEETGHIVPEVLRGPIDREIAALAERQHGVVALGQLEALALTASGVRKRVSCGRLHRIHRGVYAVGRPGLTQNGWRMAAVLAYGPGAVLSHRSAAGLWGLRPDNRPTVEISVPRRSPKRRRGVDVHGRPGLTSEDVTVRLGIPVTTVARTLVDLGEVTPERNVEMATEQAEVLHLFDRTEVEEALARADNRRGKTILTSLLTTPSATSTLTETDLEEAFLAIVRRTGLPGPEVNAHMTLPDGTPIRVDFLWRDLRLAVETDGGPYHRTRQSRERDTRRDQLLRLAGWEPVRFTDRQVAFEPEWVTRTLVALASRADDDRPGRAGTQAA